ncbi:MAG: hypothetical protein HY364_00615 [Candidatus Aenigmarchaeota archaeon]|nr:hypothetical protein [Candidatus Aenigmarchaeota archaeon]
MEIDYGKIFGRAAAYSFSAHRIVPMLAINAAMLLAALMITQSILVSVAGGSLGALFSAIGTFVIILIITTIAAIFFVTAYIHDANDYWKGKNLDIYHSYKYARSKYLKMLGATILVGTISAAISMAVGLPFISIAVDIIVGLVFLMYTPIIVLESKGLIESMKESYGIFMRNKFDLFTYWWVLTGIQLAIFAVSLIPLAIFSWPAIAAAIGGIPAAQAIQANATVISLGILAMSTMLSYATVFGISSLTFMYASLKRVKK